MRVMVFVPGDRNSEAGVMPGEELIGRMMKFNEELVKAGVMLDGQGLTPTSKAKRVRFSGSQRTVLDGPFAESKEIVAGDRLVLAIDHLLAAQHVDRAMLRSRDEPRAWIVGHARRRPRLDRRDQRLLREILGEADVAHDPHEAADEPRGLDPPDGLDGLAGGAGDHERKALSGAGGGAGRAGTRALTASARARPRRGAAPPSRAARA